MLLARGADAKALADEGKTRKTPLDFAREKANLRLNVVGAKPTDVPDEATRRLMLDIERDNRALDARRHEIAALLESKTKAP